MLDTINHQEVKSGSCSFAVALVFIQAVVLAASMCTGVEWFRPGDFEWREAMASHGLLIPAWMLLALFSMELFGSAASAKWTRVAGWMAVVAALLTGEGALLVGAEGFSGGAVVQGFGMFLADVVGLVALATLVLDRFRGSGKGFDGIACWTLIASFAALSLATPLGHLAGLVRDFGDQFFIFAGHVALLGLEPKKILEGYIGSHSHQIIAAFLAGGFVLPLVQKRQNKLGWIDWSRTAGLTLVLLATLAQATLYQFSGWFAWEPPTLFAREPNGVPLDDLVLTFLGVGLLLLVPALLIRTKGPGRGDGGPQFARPILVPLLISFTITMVGIGLYIELNEGFFGHGEEGGALGRLNDLAYIRSHLLFGCMIVPVLLGALLHADPAMGRNATRAVYSMAAATTLTGLAGVFLWTFALNPLLTKASMWLAVLFLLTLGTALLLSEHRS